MKKARKGKMIESFDHNSYEEFEMFKLIKKTKDIGVSIYITVLFLAFLSSLSMVVIFASRFGNHIGIQGDNFYGVVFFILLTLFFMFIMTSKKK